MKHLESLWREHLQAPPPREVGREELGGVDLAATDALAAGCISAFIHHGGSLDPTQASSLRSCIGDMEAALGALQGETKFYFQRLLKMARLVSGALPAGTADSTERA